MYLCSKLGLQGWFYWVLIPIHESIWTHTYPTGYKQPYWLQSISHVLRWWCYGLFKSLSDSSAHFSIVPLKQKSSICNFQDILVKLWARIIGFFLNQKWNQIKFIFSVKHHWLCVQPLLTVMDVICPTFNAYVAPRV